MLPLIQCRATARYADGEIYTFVGDILVAVNPFKPLPALYSPAQAERYNGSSTDSLRPHIFKTALHMFQ